MKIYCFTIRRTKAQATLEEVQKVLKNYLFMIEQIKKDHTTARIDYHFEVVKKKTGLNVHVHGMGALSSGALFIRPPKGYSTKIELCRSTRAWQAYITKNPFTSDQVINQAKVMLFLNSEPVTTCPDNSMESDEYIEDISDNIIIPKKKLF